jgi:thiamine-phosphate diphosphorylase / hydroxyethylthiazole kinase
VSLHRRHYVCFLVNISDSKENTKFIVGCSGIRAMLSSLAQAGYSSTKTVCIGGINASNVQRVLYQTVSIDDSHKLDGVAVVSAIVGAQNPKNAAAELKALISSPPPFARTNQHSQEAFDTSRLQALIPAIAKKLADISPLCHNMTNLVVQNIAANTALGIGASPIMSNNGLEAPDLANLGGSLVINMGTVTPEGLANYLQALMAYNKVGGPTLLDPVGAGATSQRKEAVKRLMCGGYFDVIKGNEGEIKTVAGTAGTKQQKGVDSGASTLSLEQKASLVRTVARQERNVVLLTGAVDVLSDGYRTLAIENGHEYLGAITGSGCCLGTTIASYLAVHRDEDRLMGALAGILHFEIAAEMAAERDDVKGPGTFVPAFLDELWRIRESSRNGDGRWMEKAKVRVL